MTYKEYFNTLKIPLKETSTVFKVLFTAIAEEFDSLRNFAKMIVNSHFVHTDNYLIDEQRSDEGLTSERLFAEERGIVKIKKESDKNYGQRVLSAYEFNKRSSTLEGLRDILSSATDKEFTIRELYRDDWVLGEEPLEFIEDENGDKIDTTILGSNFVSLYFVVDFDQIKLKLDEKEYLEQLIELYKPAHIGYHINAQIEEEDWRLEGVILVECDNPNHNDSQPEEDCKLVKEDELGRTTYL